MMICLNYFYIMALICASSTVVKQARHLSDGVWRGAHMGLGVAML